MIDGIQLLAGLQPLRKRLEDDLRERSEQVPSLGQQLQDEWQAARQRERTAQTYEAWRDDTLAQAAVMWLLAGVFIRFLEDNELVEPPRIGGPGSRLQLARDQRTLYFQTHPHDSDRDYLYSVFETVAALPAAAPLFDHRHNPIWSIGISGDAATALIDFWQRIDPGTGALVYDFSDPEWRTRFLGDLYQDLSESARKKYALLQTPDFVLQFILDRTLTPALAEFGFREVRLIDPACGSGHFLLAAFERLFRLWAQHEPGRNLRELVRCALAQVSGVDLNPFAVAIARFRLLVAALRASNLTALVDAPAFEIDLAVGDSLLHGPRPGEIASRQPLLDSADDPLAHVYATEDAADLAHILGRRYHVVVGNPPYITPKDAALNKAYRDRFRSCHMKYSLAVPFAERLFDLAIEPPIGGRSPAGYVGMITANSFMKREFGKWLIERYIPGWDLTHVVDTSGAYIPGHGTPTVILLGRHRTPIANEPVRAVLGIKGEPTTPGDSARGLVWQAIVGQIDRSGSSSEFISVSDTDRSTFARHPWSTGGGGAVELKERIDAGATTRLGTLCESVGFGAILGEDDAFTCPTDATGLNAVAPELRRPLVIGEFVRDWTLIWHEEVLFPYTRRIELVREEVVQKQLWRLRVTLQNRADFSKRTYAAAGRPYWEYHQIPVERNVRPLSITFAFVATHNHFVLDRGGKVFNRSAPIIKLPPSATEDDHFALLGLLNSSTACFWMKQTMSDKGNGGIGGGIGDEMWERRFEHDATKLANVPLPEMLPKLGVRCVHAAEVLGAVRPRSVLSRSGMALDIEYRMKKAHSDYEACLEGLIAIQEELDWETYGSFGLVETPVPGSDTAPSIKLGERAFEIVMARKMAADQLQSAWFERHGSTPIIEIPAHWPESYRQVVQRRIELIESNPEIALIEQPEYKRRWNIEPWAEQVQRALRDWLLDRLESQNYRPEVALISVARFADRARHDAEFMRVAALYRGQDDFDVSTLVAELIGSAAVPFLPVLRYKTMGLRKREQWERTWDLQRREDASESVGDIPVPPKYTSSDFANNVFWQLRGKLDVPKERFISYPFCQRDADPTLVVAWAGWDCLQQATALATYYVQMKDSEGWSIDRLVPLLAGLLELVPWLVQWHNDIDARYGQRMGEVYEGFVDEEARAFGLTRDAIRAWTPPAAARQRGRRAHRGRTSR